MTVRDWKPLGTLLAAMSELRVHFWTFAPFEILFKILQAGVFGPLSAVLFAAVTLGRGDRVLSNGEILEFLLSPAGALGGAALVGLAVTTALMERAGLMWIYAHALEGQRVTLFDAASRIARLVPGIIVIALVHVAAYALCIAPFATAGAGLFIGFLAGYDLNYLVSVRPPAFWWGLATATVLLVGAGVVTLLAHVRLILAFPIFLFEGRSAVASVAESRRRTRGSVGPIVRLVAAWAGGAVLAGLASAGMFELLLMGAMRVVAGGLGLAAGVVGAIAAAEILTAALLGFAALAVATIVETRCHLELGGRVQIPSSSTTDRRGDSARTRRRMLGLGLAALFGISMTTSIALVESANLEDAVLIIAHRGSSGVAPENSLSAVEQAIRDGADYAEIDVQETADGEIVVMHDTDLLRITGVDRKIWEVTYAEIADLDAGSWFSEEFRGERIPTLRETIAVARGRIKLNIELKLNGHEWNLAAAVAGIVRDENFGRECMISSLSYPTLQEVRTLDPGLETAYIIYQKVGDISRLDPEHLVVKASLVTDVLIHSAHERGKKVHAWTVNDPAAMSRLLFMGVDGILTDYPDRLVAVLEERAELTDLERVLLRARQRPWR